MISTVTVTTISTITTISSITSVAAVGMVAALSIAAMLTLVAFLTTRELVSIRTEGSSQRISQFLNVGIIPLLMVFVVVIAIAISQAL